MLKQGQKKKARGDIDWPAVGSLSWLGCLRVAEPHSLVPRGTAIVTGSPRDHAIEAMDNHAAEPKIGIARSYSIDVRRLDGNKSYKRAVESQIRKTYLDNVMLFPSRSHLCFGPLDH